MQSVSDSPKKNNSGFNNLEEGNTLLLDFKKVSRFYNYSGNDKDVVPVVVQHAVTLEVLILAYVNRLALEESYRTGSAVFWSTSRNELWIKGATSGDYLTLKEIRINCEQNTLLFLVIPQNEGVCHTISGNTGKNRTTCFYRRFRSDTQSADQVLEFLEENR